MSPSLITRTTLVEVLTGVVLMVVAGVGTIEAFGRDEPGLAALFVVLLVASVGTVTSRLARRRQSITVRSDLHRWLEATSAVAGESPATLADRCISGCRAQIETEAEQSPGPG